MDISFFGEVLKIVSSGVTLLVNLFKRKDSKRSFLASEPVIKDSVVIKDSPIHIEKVEIHLHIHKHFNDKT